MSENINVLILSCGTRNKIVQYFKRELKNKGLIIATDCSEMAPALYEADKHYIVPRIDDSKYLKTILDICKKDNIKTVFSLIDPELSILAKNKQKFLDIGTIPIISNYKTVDMCFDKYLFNQSLLKHNIKTAKSYIDKNLFYNDIDNGNINYPVFVKPIRGSASININKVNSKEEIEALFSKHNDLLIQEFMQGKEYGVDVYIDLISGEVVSIFAKEKIKMRAGETDKSVSIKDDNLFQTVEKLVEKLELRGVIDIDIFSKNDEYYISEVNPRFGGGYPHAHECGINMPKMIINNINNTVNEKKIGNYEKDIYMMKFNEIKIFRRNT